MKPSLPKRPCGAHCRPPGAAPLFKAFVIMLMLAGLALPAMSQQIDSIQEAMVLDAAGFKPRQATTFHIYVSDTANIDSISIKLGYAAGGTEMLDEIFAAEGLAIQYNATTQAAFLQLYVGAFELVPPFIDAFIIRRNGTLSPVYSKQIVY